ncbi:MAG TPA: DUF1707 domain-containing protein, partial [Streptosporangiaceae bacterium]|nr:DUF1707 domain-containing protein [Streptosporangiaceae bacterium]
MSDSPDNRPDLRISDIDRDRAAEVLREAHAQGRITVDELDERLARDQAGHARCLIRRGRDRYQG